MAVMQPTDVAFETHLEFLTRALDLQTSLVRSALDLHPSASLVDFREAAEDAISKFNFAIGDLRSDLNSVATALASSGEPPTGTVEAQSSRSCLRPRAASTIGLPAKRASIDSEPESLPSGDASHLRNVSYARAETDTDRVPQRRSSRKMTPDSEIVGAVSPDSVVAKSTTEARVSYSRKAKKANEAPCINGVLNPDWPVRLAWDMLVILLVLCDSVVIPVQLAEFRTSPEFDDVWLCTTVSIFFCDLVLNFWTGYQGDMKQGQEKQLVTSKAMIAIHYLRGWFWIDFLSTVPWNVIAGALKPKSEKNTTSDGLKLAKVVKLMRLLRLMRMLRLCKIGVIWERLEARIGSITALNVVSMVKVLGIWTAICHWGACIWWMVGKRDSLVMLVTMQDAKVGGLHWTEVPRMHSAFDESWTWVERPASEQYVFCFYWILGVMRTMPAEVTPVNLTERMFVLLFMFFAVGAFAVNIARITQAWFRFSARKDAFKEEMVHVRAHLRSISCDYKLQQRTQAYLNHLFEKRKLHAKEMSLLSVLPEGLKRKLNEAHRIHFIVMIPRVQELSEAVLRRVCHATEVLDYLPGDKVTEKNKDAEAAYVVMRGGVEVYVPTMLKRSLSKLSKLSDFSNLSARSDALTVVDDHCLFELGEKTPSRNTVLAVECSELLRVDRKGFQEIVLAHGPSAELLRRRRVSELSACTSVSSFAAGTPIVDEPTRKSPHGPAVERFLSSNSFAQDLRGGPLSPNAEPTLAGASLARIPLDDEEQEGGVGGMRQVESLRPSMSRRLYGLGSFREWQHVSAGQLEAVG